jgi:predicted dehydrogenase
MSSDVREASPRFLILGCGSIGRRHAANLRRLAVDEILVHDPDRGRMQALARDWGVTPCAHREEAYARVPAAALVCAPSSLHVALAREAMLHGCHVFVEKPIAHSLDGVDELIGLARDRERVLMVGYNLRFNACARRVECWLRSGRIGHVASARLHVGSYLPWRHPWEDYRQGYGARRELGGGVILDAVHEIDYALWFFGTPDRVYCVSGKFSSLEIDTEDVAELLLSYPDRKAVSIHLDYLQRPHQRWCELIGDEGVIRCDLVGRSVHLFDASRREWLVFEDESAPNDEYVREMERFVECVEGRSQAVVDGPAARRSLALALAAKRSAVDGQPVDLEPEPLAGGASRAPAPITQGPGEILGGAEPTPAEGGAALVGTRR